MNLGRNKLAASLASTYGFVASRGEYRKWIKGPDGQSISLYTKTPDELAD